MTRAKECEREGKATAQNSGVLFSNVYLSYRGTDDDLI